MVIIRRDFLRFVANKISDKIEVDVSKMPISRLKNIQYMTSDQIKIVRAYLEGTKKVGNEKFIDLENAPDFELIAKYHKQKKKIDIKVI